MGSSGGVLSSSPVSFAGWIACAWLGLQCRRYLKVENLLLPPAHCIQNRVDRYWALSCIPSGGAGRDIFSVCPEESVVSCSQHTFRFSFGTDGNFSVLDGKIIPDVDHLDL